MDGQETSDIQSYLASFNKEIEYEEIDESDQENEDSNHESNGECSSKKKAAEIIRLGSKTDTSSGSSPVNDDGAIAPIVEELQIDDQQTLEMVAQFAEQAVAKVTQDGEGSYQAVTIVPSDTNPGELCYVLFVSDSDDYLNKNAEDVNLAMYDLNNHEQFDDSYVPDQDIEGVKMHAIRLSSRRTPILTQQYVCNYCNYTSCKRYLLSRHMKSHSDERPHKCVVCERGFKTVASLQNHVNTHTGTRPHPCKECDSCFTTSGELIRHVRYKHTHEKPHKCTECDYASVELSKLKRHMRCHTGERPYQCPQCTYASPDTYKLKRHLRIHTGEKPYECDICQTRFTQSNSLKAHKLIHTGNKPIFHCEYCPATCGRKTDLRIHMEKLHSSDNPHRCKRCGKTFLDRYSYKIHIRSHDGEKCFKCDLCNYASISQRHLETHMLVHTDQKPFRCDECDQCFRQKQLLKRHKNIYHDPSYVRPEPKEKNHICALCSKAFRHKGNLIRHYALHDPKATSYEREVALRLGEPKNPGEDHDGEEDEDDDDDLKDTDEKNDQQVVVFEVIQLPSSNGMSTDDQSITLADGHTLMLSGDDSQGYSIIERAEDEVDFMDFNESISDSEDVENISSASSYKYNCKTKVKSKIKFRKNPKQGIRNADSSSARRKSSNFKKGSRILKAVPDKEISLKEHLIIDTSDGSEIGKDKDIEHARGLQVQKDLEDCFGFDEKEDDLLSISNGSSYESFHSPLVEDVS